MTKKRLPATVKKKQPKHLRGIKREKMFEHGKPWMYEKKRCYGPACFACWDAARRYRKKNVYRRDAGLQQKRVDPAPARNAVRKMINRGLTLTFIANETGAHINTIKRLYRIDYEAKWMLSGLSEKLIALHASMPEVIDTHYKHLNDPRVARLAIRGMMRQGWGQVWIAEKTGISRYGISEICAGNVQYIKPENAEKIINLAREVGSAEGDNNRSRSYAEKQGWQTTMMYDELL